MLPANTVFPEFVPDQLLTSDDLNELFGYLDEQGRMTRTNLIGIGIVCGMEVQANAAGTSVTITKGCGVTSEGYLVTVPAITYTEFNTFDAVKERYYDRFVDIGEKTQKIDLWELKQPAVDPDAENLSQNFLEDKVVMIFVELLEEENKNCDPSSCDDKGLHITISFRPLLVTKTDAADLKGAIGSITTGTFTGLPEIKMPRFDVPNTSPVSSEHLFSIYRSLLSNPFLVKVQNALGEAHTLFFPFVSGEFPLNPFAGFANGLAFITNGTISSNQLIHIQYYYDLLSDILQAYDEFRKTGRQLISACCPDSNLFPRHLLLGEAIPLSPNVRSLFRHYFIYSPLFEQRNFILELKALFFRIVELKNQFFLPPVNNGSPASIDPNIRITPSKLGDVFLSQKAIPYYYHVNAGTTPLYKLWSFEKTIRSIPERNLSYHANEYNITDDFVLTPLKYDLEPYNFLRIEGIIGKSYVSVLRNIKRQILTYRLPFNIIALGTDDYRLYKDSFTSLFSADLINRSELSKMLCHFQDLESLYETIKAEVLCTLCKELKYYYDFRINFRTTQDASGATAKPVPSKVGLFDHCHKGYIIQPGTFGVLIEKVYDLVGDEGEINIQSIAEALGIEDLLPPDNNGDGNPDNLTAANLALLTNTVTLFRIPINLIRLSQLFTEDLATFDASQYCSLYQKIIEEAASLKFLFNMYTASERQSIRDTALGIKKEVKVNPATGSAAEGGAAASEAKANMLTAAGISSLALNETNSGRILLLIFLLEDFFDHLDALIYNCKCSALKALKREYLNRYAHLTRLMHFGYYTRLHPGIQHKAGVPIGGTFLIVYHKRKIKAEGQVMQGKFVIRGVVLDEDKEPVTGATIRIKNTTKATITDVTGRFTITLTTLPAVMVIAYIGFEPKEVEVTSDDPLEIILGEPTTPDNIVDRIPEGTVIADFYLPYLCCSDCPPIQYVVKELTETPPDNRGPVVSAGPDHVITLPVNTVTLNGSASDPDGTITSFLWTKLRGPASFELQTPDSAQTAVRGLVEGEYEFELTVRDDKGDAARDSAIVKVNPAPPQNRPPVADAGKDRTITLSPNNPLLLDGTNSSDPEGSALSYFWEFIGADDAPSKPVFISPNADKTFVTGLVPGTYQFKLTVKDDKGASDDDTVTIAVIEPPNQPPSANAGKDIPIVLPVNTATLLGSGEDPERGPLTFSWSIVSKPEGAPDPKIGNANFAQTQVSGLQQGTYEFELKATDNKGAEARDTVKVIVNPAPRPNRPPLADAGRNAITHTDADSVVTLNGNQSSDPDGKVEKYQWKLIEGPGPATIEDADKAITRVTNFTDGRYKFRLVVFDNDQAASAPDHVYVWARKESNLRKRCISLETIPSLIKDFQSADRENFQLFQKEFRFFDEVEKFFKSLEEIISKPEPDQFNALAGLNVAPSMERWLGRLFEIISDKSAASSKVRLLALKLFRILAGVAMYIACKQKEDIGEAQVPMAGVIEAINMISRLEPGFIKDNFSEVQLKALLELQTLFNEEMSRLLTSPDTAGKPVYFGMISGIVVYFEELTLS